MSDEPTSPSSPITVRHFEQESASREEDKQQTTNRSSPGLLSSSEKKHESSPVCCCWICLENESTNNKEPLLRGCACRGTSGYAHISCLVDMATTTEILQIQNGGADGHKRGINSGGDKVNYWTECPTCLQCYTGKIEMELALALWDMFGNTTPPENRNRLHALNNLACAYHDEGGHSKAIELFEELLENERKLLDCATKEGEDNEEDFEIIESYKEEVTRSLYNLAKSHGMVGEYEKTQVLLNEAMQMASNPRDLLEIRMTLAYLYQDTDQEDKALPLFLQVKEESKQLLGSDHEVTIGVNMSLAAVHIWQGNIAKGMPLLYECAKRAERVLGPDHHRTLGTMQLLNDLEPLVLETSLLQGRAVWKPSALAKLPTVGVAGECENVRFYLSYIPELKAYIVKDEEGIVWKCPEALLS